MAIAWTWRSSSIWPPETPSSRPRAGLCLAPDGLQSGHWGCGGGVAAPGPALKSSPLTLGEAGWFPFKGWPRDSQVTPAFRKAAREAP